MVLSHGVSVRTLIPEDRYCVYHEGWRGGDDDILQYFDRQIAVDIPCLLGNLSTIKVNDKPPRNVSVVFGVKIDGTVRGTWWWWCVLH